MVRVQKYERAGRPTSYNSEMLDKAYEYLNDCKSDEDIYERIEDDTNDGGVKVVRRYGTSGKVSMPNTGGLAVHLQVARDTLYEWARVHDDFAYFMDLMNAIREDRLHEGGLSGRYSSSITAIMLGKYGYHKIIDANISNPDGSLRPLEGLTTDEVKALAQTELVKKAK